MQKWVLKNGLKVIFEKKKARSVAVEVLVNVGSNDENANQKGISHFIEHMVFEGTGKRANAMEIANEIESLGGEMNAYTSGARTCYYTKILGKYFDVALDVLGDILQNPLFREEDVEKQKNILFKEIDMVLDEPRFYQWILFQRTMFKKHPSRFPTYGTKASVAKMKAFEIRKYFEQSYFPRNMAVVVVGNVGNVKKKVEKYFKFKINREKNLNVFKEPEQKENRFSVEKRRVENSYLVLGHRTAPHYHDDSYVIDVIDAVLGRGQSGWMFDEIRNRHGLAYEVATQHVAERDYGLFATQLSTDKENLKKVRLMVLDQLKRLQKISINEVKEAQRYIEGNYCLSYEDTQKVADDVAVWEQMGDLASFEKYIERIKKVSVADVKRVSRKYFTKPYCMAVIEGK